MFVSIYFQLVYFCFVFFYLTWFDYLFEQLMISFIIDYSADCFFINLLIGFTKPREMTPESPRVKNDTFTMF